MDEKCQCLNLSNGLQCKMKSIPGKEFCYFHERHFKEQMINNVDDWNAFAREEFEKRQRGEAPSRAKSPMKRVPRGPSKKKQIKTSVIKAAEIADLTKGSKALSGTDIVIKSEENKKKKRGSWTVTHEDFVEDGFEVHQNFVNGKLHSLKDQPALTIYDPKNRELIKKWFIFGKEKRDPKKGPSMTSERL